MTTNTIDPEQRIEHLAEVECWQRLLTQQVGRLAFSAHGRTEILPLNYVVRGRAVVFRTTSDAGLLQPQPRTVPFEVDGWTTTTAWSVVARGTIAMNTSSETLALEQEFGLAPWAPDEGRSRDTLAVLDVEELSGRVFHRRVDEQARWY